MMISHPMYPRSFQIQPSRKLLYWILLVHLATAVVVALTPMPFWLKSLLLVVVVIALQQVIIRWTKEHPQRIAAIEIHDEKSWVLKSGAAIETAMQLEGCRVFRQLIYLRFISETGQRQTLLLADDAIDADVHRRLRARLGYFRLSLAEDQT